MGLGGESLLLVGVCVRVLPPYSLFNELTLTLFDASTGAFDASIVA